MTRVEKVDGIQKTTTDLGYCAFVGDDGKKYFRIETYGSDSRATPGSPTQILVFDEDHWKKLVSESFTLQPPVEPA